VAGNLTNNIPSSYSNSARGIINSERIRGTTQVSYITDIYERNFSIHKELDRVYEELLPYFSVSHSLMTQENKDELLGVAYMLRDGYEKGKEGIRKYFSLLSIKMDLYSIEAFVKYRMSRKSTFLVRHLSDTSPKKEDYEIAIELTKDLLEKDKLSYSERPSQGVFRKVFTFDDFVVKYEYLLGQQINEVGLWFNKPDLTLCPIDYVSEDGHFVIMPRADRTMNIEAIAKTYNFDPEGEGLYLASGAKVWELAEESNWGVLEGRYVIVDYGASSL
jgi:hypothetical protein